MARAVGRQCVLAFPGEHPGEAAIELHVDKLESFPHARNSDTSESAARSLSKLKTFQDRERIYEFILRRGDYGATDEEMQRELGIPGSSQRPRRGELAGDRSYPKRITKHGKRPTRSGNLATVWVAV